MGWESGEKREFKFDPNSTENEGRWRLYDPKKIDKDSYFRRKSSTPGVSYVMGKVDGKSVIQAVRFDKDKFTESEAAEWWSKNQGRGELVFSNEREKKAMIVERIASRIITDWETARRIESEIWAWAHKAGVTSSHILAGVEKRMMRRGISLKDAVEEVYKSMVGEYRRNLGDDLFEQMKAEGGISWIRMTEFV